MFSFVPRCHGLARSQKKTGMPVAASVLFDRATAWLVDAKVLLPGATVLARLIASIRERAAEELFRTLAERPGADQRARLEGLLGIEEKSRTSKLDRLRRAPTKLSAASLAEALERVQEILALGVSDLDLSGVPPARIAALGRTATARAQAIDRMAPERRLATLLAAARLLEASATDDALDVFDQLLAQQLSRAKRQSDSRAVGDPAEARGCSRCVVLGDRDPARPSGAVARRRLGCHLVAMLTRRRGRRTRDRS